MEKFALSKSLNYLYRGLSAVEALKSDAKGSNILEYLHMDVTDEESVGAAVSQFQERFPQEKLFCLINNAGRAWKGGAFNAEGVFSEFVIYRYLSRNYF